MAVIFGPLFGVATDIKTSALIQQARDFVQGRGREVMNLLASDFLDTSDQAVLKYPIAGIAVGQTVEIGWVEYTVVGVATSSLTITLIPVVTGSQVTHLAGSQVRVLPKYPARVIVEKFNSELHALSAEGIYRIVAVDASNGIVNVPSGALAVLDVWSNDPEPRRLPPSMYSIADLSAGPALRGAQTIATATFGCVLNPLSLTVDEDVSTVTGIMPQATDLLPLGVAVRLTLGTEAQRNLLTTQGETRRAGEVPNRANLEEAQGLAGLRQQRLNQEVGRIRERFPYQSHVGVY